jgi:hypothetical protein
VFYGKREHFLTNLLTVFDSLVAWRNRTVYLM